MGAIEYQFKMNTKALVRQFIQDNFIMGSAGVQFGDSDSFMDSHLLDSTGFLEVVTFLEETFGIAVLDEEMVPENLDSLSAIEAYVSRKLSQ
jgi:acyl carrier protein